MILDQQPTCPNMVQGLALPPLFLDKSSDQISQSLLPNFFWVLKNPKKTQKQWKKEEKQKWWAGITTSFSS
jgi:hypothetical protein